MHTFDSSDAVVREIWELIEQTNISNDDKKRLAQLLSRYRSQTLNDAWVRFTKEYESLKSKAKDYYKID